MNAAWRTSMEVGVRVESENVRSGERTHTSTAYLTMVALDEEGRPATVPPLGRARARRAREEQRAGGQREEPRLRRDEFGFSPWPGGEHGMSRCSARRSRGAPGPSRRRRCAK